MAEPYYSFVIFLVVQTDSNTTHQKGSISSSEPETRRFDQGAGRKRFPFKIEIEVDELVKEVLISGSVVVRLPPKSVPFARPQISKNQVVTLNEGN